LRKNPGSDAPAAAANPPGNSTTDPNPPLSKDEVIDLANTIARARGYNPAGYEPPEAEYHTSDDTWSLSYDQKAADGTADAGKHFSVKVDGKTKKVVIEPPK
jgi:hypothetical protein